MSTENILYFFAGVGTMGVATTIALHLWDRLVTEKRPEDKLADEDRKGNWDARPRWENTAVDGASDSGKFSGLDPTSSEDEEKSSRT